MKSKRAELHFFFSSSQQEHAMHKSRCSRRKSLLIDVYLDMTAGQITRDDLLRLTAALRLLRLCYEFSQAEHVFSFECTKNIMQKVQHRSVPG